MSKALGAIGPVTVVVVVATLLSAVYAEAVPRLGTAVIVRLDGEAVYKSESDEGNIEEGMAFTQGQRLVTKEDGKIVSVLTPGCVLCIAPETTVDLKRIELTTQGLPSEDKRVDKQIVLDMPAEGAMRFDAGSISPNLTLTVKTPAGDVIASGGRAIIAKDGQDWRVIVENEFVEFDQDGKRSTVKQNEVLTATPDGGSKNYSVRTDPIDLADLKDDFVGCRRDAERLGPVVFETDHVGYPDLLDFMGDKDTVDVRGASTFWADVSPTVRKSTIETTKRNFAPEAGPKGGGGRDREYVWDWYGDIGTIKGVNYVSSTSVNSTEMWQEDTFDLDTIDKELSYASGAGYTSVRAFVPYLVWAEDAKGLKDRMQDFLGKARKHGIGTVFVLFDDNNQAGRDPYLGKQDDPIPGVHNSQWTPCPGRSMVTNKADWASLERYIKDIVGSFRNDRRILFWDLYNEPGSFGMGEKSLPLVEAAFEWARAENPKQPLTCGIWSEMTTRMSKTLMELSDIISFRAYENEPDLKAKVLLCQTLGRPLVCTEWLRRDTDSTFENILPIFSDHHVGWFHWGLVAGRTQTYLPFDSKKGSEDTEKWQFDVLRDDGKPYDTKEIELIRNFVFQP